MRNQHSFVSKTKDIFNRSLYSLIAAMVVLPLAFAALVWIFIFVAVVLFAIARVQDEAWSSTQKNLSQNPGPPEDSTPSFILSILEYILKASEDTTNYSFELEVRISDTSVTTTTYVEVSSCDTAEELKAKICLKGSLSSLGPLCLFFCGRELQDGHSLLDQSVVPGSVVFLVNQRLIVKCDQSQKVLILDFGSEDSVHDIKAKIWVKTGPFPVEQSLFLAGEQLKDSYGLCNYNIRFGSILHLVLDQRPRDTREVLICAPNGKTIVLNPPIWTSIRDLKDALGHIVGLEPFFQTLTLRGTSTRLPPDLTLRDIEEGIRARWRPDYTFQFLVVHNGRHYQSAVAPKSGRESEWGLEKPEAASTGFVSLDKIHPPSEYEQELVNCRAYGSRAPYPKEIESTAEPQLPVYSAAERVIHLQSSLDFDLQSPDSVQDGCAPMSESAHTASEVEYSELDDASREITCQIQHCMGKFKTQTDYGRHMRYHDKPAQCPHCGVGWGTTKDLNRHINSVHHTTTVYHCSVEGCTKSSSRKDNLKRHEKEHKKRLGI